MTRTFNRGQFFYMHALRCSECREDWMRFKEGLPESRHAKVLEEVVRANHWNSTIIK